MKFKAKYFTNKLKLIFIFKMMENNGENDDLNHFGLDDSLHEIFLPEKKMNLIIMNMIFMLYLLITQL